MVTCLFLISLTLLKSTMAKDCLECYQCSDVTDPFSPCDDSLWHITTQKERENMTVGCLPSIAEFCVKVETTKVMRLRNHQTTQRGCSGVLDLAGNKLVEGCISYQEDGIDYRICLCSTSLCNSVGIIGFRIISLSITVLVVLFAKDNLLSCKR